MARLAVRVFRTAVTWIAEHVGRRGGVMLAFAYLDWMIADGLRTLPEQSRFVYQGAELLMPIEWWAWLWLAVSVLMLVQAFMKRDEWGYGVGTGIQVIWAIGLMLSAQVYDVPRAGWLSSIFLTFAALQLLNAGGKSAESVSGSSGGSLKPAMVGLVPVRHRALGAGYLGVLPGENEGPIRESPPETDP